MMVLIKLACLITIMLLTTDIDIKFILKYHVYITKYHHEGILNMKMNV